MLNLDHTRVCTYLHVLVLCIFENVGLHFALASSWCCEFNFFLLSVSAASSQPY